MRILRRKKSRGIDQGKIVEAHGRLTCEYCFCLVHDRGRIPFTIVESICACGESVRNAELRIGRKGNEPIDALVSAENVSINGQNCVLIAWLDISERKRSEIELVSAIETVMKDASWFSRSLVEKLANVSFDFASASAVRSGSVPISVTTRVTIDACRACSSRIDACLASTCAISCDSTEDNSDVSLASAIRPRVT